jgi:elongation factor G
MEVEVSTRVLDGCVLVVDAVAGVQCQTKTVWRKIAGRSLPAVVFVNKMDRVGADFSHALNSIERDLAATPLALQLPVLDSQSQFEGYIDLLSRQIFRWPIDMRSHEPPSIEKIAAGHEFWSTVEAGRVSLFDSLSEADDDFLAICLEKEYESITPLDAIPALRRASLARKILPTFCGVALRGKGVHALLDGILAFLPSPADMSPVLLQRTSDDDEFLPGGILMRNQGDKLTDEIQQQIKLQPKAFSEKHDKLCALAFKVVHDPMRGMMVYTRVFSGKLSAKENIFNATTHKNERIQQVLSISGEDFAPFENETAGPGSVCCLIGLKHARSGDALLDDRDDSLRKCVLPGVQVPKPVFALAIEPATSAQQRDLETALKILCIEDPSLVAELDNESGQTILRGLGELHLEIAVDKLRRQHKLQVYTGRAYVGYRETIAQDVSTFDTKYERVLDGKRIFAQFSLEVIAQPSSTQDASFLVDDAVKKTMSADEYTALNDSLRNGLLRGPRGYPVVGLQVRVHGFAKDAGTTPGAIRACLSTALVQLLLAPDSQQLLEPLMTVEVEVPDQYVGDVVNELTAKRRAQELEIRSLGTSSIVVATVPLQSTLGYATSLRSMTHGEGSFTAEYHSHVPVSLSDASL